MKEGETRRLIYARKVMDVEFDKCVNTQVSKWEMVADLWNNGFVVKSKILAGVREDIVFPVLPLGEHATGARLQNKWEKVSKYYRYLMLLNQNIDNEVKKRTKATPSSPSQSFLRLLRCIACQKKLESAQVLSWRRPGQPTSRSTNI
jgi:hypothetical protein